MKSVSGVVRITVMLIFLIPITLAIESCETSGVIRIYNQTTETLRIFTEDKYLGEAAPGKTLSREMDTSRRMYNFNAKDKTGKTVYNAYITLDEMKANKWRVVIPATARNMEQSGNATVSENTTGE